MNNKLKKIIFDKLYQDLKNVEIIPYAGSIWFIDREKKYWYFKYEKSGSLWWNYNFFSKFFILFSLKMDDYKPIISEWMEEVLNCKVNTIKRKTHPLQRPVEEVLNCKVNTTKLTALPALLEVEEVLNYKVNTTSGQRGVGILRVEEVLNCKVNTTYYILGLQLEVVEEVLNYKVNTTQSWHLPMTSAVEEVLNQNK